MNIKRHWLKTVSWITALAFTLGLSNLIPIRWDNVPIAKAANFSFETGYYGGNSTSTANQVNTGWSPDLVMAKATSTAGTGFWWKTSAMPANTTSYLTATAANTGTVTTFNSTGFTVQSSTINNVGGIIWYYAAWDGSDCSASGTFCVGSYTANNGVATNITTVGFQPTLVWVKKRTTTARASSMKTDAMASTESCTWAVAAACDTTNITGFISNGFSIGTGTSANEGTATYDYVAFKDVSGMFNAGTYTAAGTPVDGTTISSVFGTAVTPQFVMVKNKTQTTNTAAVGWFTDHYNDRSEYFSDTAGTNNMIQSAVSDGFTIGTASTVQTASSVYYYFVFAGAATSYTGASGTFQMAVGSYTGNSTGTSTQSVTGLSFKPQLVIVKSESTQQAVFKLPYHIGAGGTTDTASYLASATTDVTDCLRTLNSDGFTIGQSTVCNNNTTVYHYQAFAGGYNPNTRSGAADFAFGMYMGTSVDSTNINRTGIAPNMVALKRQGATTGYFKTSTLSGDAAIGFATQASTADIIQSLSGTDGFQRGNNAGANTAASIYWWFAFKKNSASQFNFDEGTYTGDGTSNRSLPTSTVMITQPNLVWIKGSSTQAGVLRPSSISNSTDSTLVFGATAAQANRIDQLNAIPPGFRVDNNTETNTLSSTYYYVMWRIPVYTPQLLDWRWFDAENDSDANLDTTNGGYKTTGDALAAENSAPSDLDADVAYPGNIFKLRVKITETDGITGTDVKYKLQYDTSALFTAPTDVGANNSVNETFTYDSDNSDGYADDAAIGTTKLSGSPSAGRHNEDNQIGVGQGSTFDPSASTTYEHEFIVQENITTALSPPLTKTRYYFRILFYEGSAGTSSAGMGVGGWTVVPLNSSPAYTIPFIVTAPAFDLSIESLPTTVDLGCNNGSGSYQYTFGAGATGEEIAFWDKRSSASSYSVNVDKFNMIGASNPLDIISGSDITWTSTAASLNSAFASSTASMTGQNGATVNNNITAYSASGGTVGDGGFYFLPTLSMINLDTHEAQLYKATIVLTVV